MGYEQHIKLRDGSEILIRHMDEFDLESSKEFFQSLPEEEKQCMRNDVSIEDNVGKRFKSVISGVIARLIVTCKDKIIGEGSLETMRYGWLAKSGEVRLMVLPEYRHLDVDEILAREIFLMAARRGLNNLVARVCEKQKNTYNIFKKLHFCHEATQRCHIVDLNNELQDLSLMTFSLKKMWRSMDDLISENNAVPFEW